MFKVLKWVLMLAWGLLELIAKFGMLVIESFPTGGDEAGRPTANWWDGDKFGNGFGVRPGDRFDQ